jgi:hypothetical protein
MKNRFFPVYITFILIVLLILFSRCGDSTRPVVGTLVIHEWGVMVGCEADTEYTATSRPEIGSLVREPVIYVYTDSIDHIDVSVDFTAGHPTLTYPETDTAGSIVSWDNIGVNIAPMELILKQSDFVPLEDIIDELNNVDANLLYHGSTASHFLFYEGIVPFENQVDVTYDLETGSAEITNNADYTIYQIVFVASEAAAAPILPYRFVFFDSLQPGELLSASLTNNMPVSWYTDLTSLGFTGLEASAFLNLWSETFLLAGGTNEANLIYRIPQAKYDEMFPLTVNPVPDTTLRAMYVLVHLGTQVEGAK